MIKKILKPFVPELLLKRLRTGNTGNEAFKTGHYYSAIPSLIDINKRSSEIFSMKDNFNGIDLHYDKQLENLEEFRALNEVEPFSLDKKIRFDVENDSFSYDDAPVLQFMLRKIKPKRIIEIGCGHSSAVMLDTNELYLNNTIEDFTFIDIDLTRLKSRLTGKDEEHIQMIEKSVSEVDLSIFKKLKTNDLLFIDSSHVSKIGSELHTLIFKILPELESGVYIHFHDIRYPFEYSREMINQKVFWNEAYLLRAFLMFNDHFEISFWLNCLINHDQSNRKLLDFLPLHDWDRRFNGNNGDISTAGGSIYLKKVK